MPGIKRSEECGNGPQVIYVLHNTIVEHFKVVGGSEFRFRRRTAIANEAVDFLFDILLSFPLIEKSEAQREFFRNRRLVDSASSRSSFVASPFKLFSFSVPLLSTEF